MTRCRVEFLILSGFICFFFIPPVKSGMLKDSSFTCLQMQTAGEGMKSVRISSADRAL